MPQTKSYTCSYVNMTDILADLHITGEDAEDFFRWYMDWVSFGDATYTMIGNNQMLAQLQRYWKDQQKVDLTETYWKLVGENDYINLESN